MTTVALGVGRHMAAVLAGGRYPIVTARAVTAHTLMREVGDPPIQRGVASVAGSRGRHMPDMFARGRHAVVTTLATAGDQVVIEADLDPVAG